MRRIVARLLVALALVTPAMAVVAPPTASAANADAIVFNGLGVIFPGLNAIPGAQAFAINGVATVAGTNSGTYPCVLNGIGYADNWVEGVGGFAGSCGPIAVSCVYVRVVVYVPVACVQTGPLNKIATGLFAFNPNQLPPSVINNFTLTGVAAYADGL